MGPGGGGALEPPAAEVSADAAGAGFLRLSIVPFSTVTVLLSLAIGFELFNWDNKAAKYEV